MSDENVKVGIDWQKIELRQAMEAGRRLREYVKAEQMSEKLSLAVLEEGERKFKVVQDTDMNWPEWEDADDAFREWCFDHFPGLLLAAKEKDEWRQIHDGISPNDYRAKKVEVGEDFGKRVQAVIDRVDAMEAENQRLTISLAAAEKERDEVEKRLAELQTVAMDFVNVEKRYREEAMKDGAGIGVVLKAAEAQEALMALLPQPTTPSQVGAGEKGVV